VCLSVKTRRWECDRPGVEPTSPGLHVWGQYHSSEKVSCDEWYWNPSPHISGYMCGARRVVRGLCCSQQWHRPCHMSVCDLVCVVCVCDLFFLLTHSTLIYKLCVPTSIVVSEGGGFVCSRLWCCSCRVLCGVVLVVCLFVWSVFFFLHTPGFLRHRRSARHWQGHERRLSKYGSTVCLSSQSEL